MPEKATTTTPDPELSTPLGTRPAPKPAEKVLSGDGARGETAGCPTGLASGPQAQQPQQPGGGGAPGTGVNPEPPASPGEGVTEEQMKRSGDQR
jgi:hypothetical protein